MDSTVILDVVYVGVCVYVCVVMSFYFLFFIKILINKDMVMGN